MDDNKNGDERNAILLEGMYNGVAGKIDEVCLSVQRELQYSSEQQANAYETLTDELRAGVEAVLAELRYVAQQSSAIYDYNSRERDAMRDKLLEEVKAQAGQVFEKLAQHIDARLMAFTVPAVQQAEVKVDYDVLAEKVAEKLAAMQAEKTESAPVQEEEPVAVVEPEPAGETAQAEEPAEPEEAKPEAAAEEPAEEPTEEPEEPTEEAAQAEPAATRAVHFDDETFDYDLLAEKIATVIPEIDYDLVADKVAAALPQADEDALAERIAAAIPQVDENTIADKVAENIPLTDYDLVAEHVVAAIVREQSLKIGEESIEKIARRVAELLRGDETDLEQIARDTLAEDEKEPEPPQEAAAEETPVSAAVPVPVAVAPVAVPEPPDGMMTRYKRSFIAKIIESDEEVKGYYSDLKNALLAYQKAASQVSWTNDRFTLKGETVAKIGIRGRTLCLYVALNPDEFPESVYHQKYAGDTKMYEKTPMMVRIKSGVALKRAIRLVELLMEKNGAVVGDTARVDYVAQYAYRSEQELLAEGLIKTAIVERSDLDF